MPTSGAVQAGALSSIGCIPLERSSTKPPGAMSKTAPLGRAILFGAIGIVACLAVLTDRRGRSLECLRRLFVSIVQDLQGYEVRLKILGLLVEIRAAGPNIWLGLGVGFADVGNFGKCVVQKPRQKHKASDALLYCCRIIWAAFHDRAEWLEVVPDQRIDGFAVLDGYPCRRGNGRCGSGGWSR